LEKERRRIVRVGLAPVIGILAVSLVAAAVQNGALKLEYHAMNRNLGSAVRVLVTCVPGSFAAKAPRHVMTVGVLTLRPPLGLRTLCVFPSLVTDCKLFGHQ